jgi:hypothetical protein
MLLARIDGTAPEHKGLCTLPVTLMKRASTGAAPA